MFYVYQFYSLNQVQNYFLNDFRFLLELYEAQILLSEHIVKFIETLMLKPHEELLECTCHIILYTSYELVLVSKLYFFI